MDRSVDDFLDMARKNKKKARDWLTDAFDQLGSPVEGGNENYGAYMRRMKKRNKRRITPTEPSDY